MKPEQNYGFAGQTLPSGIASGVGIGRDQIPVPREVTLTERVMQLTQELHGLREEMNKMANDHYNRIVALENKVG